MRRLLLAGALLLGAGSARAQFAPPPPPPLQPQQPPRPFARGTMVGGGALGLAAGGGRTDFTVGASFGYFVLDGISPGVSTLLTWSNVAPTTFEIAPYLRIIPWRAYPISPILIVRGGYLFVGDGVPDLWFIGGGGGAAFFTTPRVAFTLEAIYTRYLSSSPVYDPDDWTIVGGIGVYF